MPVGGVGKTPQLVKFDCHLPIAFKKAGLDGGVTQATLHVPTLSDSQVPGLLGLNALRKMRAIIDFDKNILYRRGPGDYDLDKAMPPGTESYQLEHAISGHLALPCCEYKEAKPNTDTVKVEVLNLMATDVPPPPQYTPRVRFNS